MEVVSHCELPVVGRVWKPRPGQLILTFVCKATFAIAPGKLGLAPEQQPVHEFDRPWSESVQSLYAATDLVPRKLRADVVLIGNAYAPGGVPTEMVVARLTVGEMSKAVEVWCDRQLRADGKVASGPPFTHMPLLYERASGGPGTDNPVGMSRERDAFGAVALPNLTLPGARIGLDATIAPAGFGPLGARWPARLGKLGRYGDELSLESWHDKPLPPDFDMAYFNMAPADQQPTALRGDERIVLENLHPEHAQLTMTLPAIQPRAKVSGPGGERSVTMRCDTLWIDTSRGICCLTYRGQVLLSSAAEAGWVVVTLDPSEKEDTAVRPRSNTLTGTMSFEDPLTPAPQQINRGPAATLPFVSSPDADSAASERDARASRGLPFQATGSSMIMPRPSELSPAPYTGTPFRQEGGAAERVLVSPPWSSASVVTQAPQVTQGPRPPQTQPAPAMANNPVLPPLPPPARSPSAPIYVAEPLRAPDPVAPAPVVPVAESSPWAQPSGGLVPGTIAPVVAAPATVAPTPGDFRAGGAGGLLASNAAAGVVEARPAPRAPEPSRPLVSGGAAARLSPVREPDAVDLVFFDAESLPRIRRVTAWKKLLARLDERPLEGEEDDPAAAKDPMEIEDRREILEILLRAEPSEAPAVDEALARAVREDGRFQAPLVLLAGDLSTPFDEVETLKSTVTTVTPLVGNDENLRASLEIAKNFLDLPGLSSSPAVTEGLTLRVRDAFNAGRRTVPAGYLDAQTERALLERRFYQKRLVLGGRRQRALFHFVSGSGPSSATPLPTYLPDDVGPKLPMFARFKVRMVARVHLPIDQYEQSQLALETLALARLVPPALRSPR